MSETKIKIIELINENPGVTLKNIILNLGISKQAVSKHLKELILLGKIKKLGLPPKVFYFINDETVENSNNYHISDEINNFGFIDELGNKMEGKSGFIFWCNKRGFDVDKKSDEYKKISRKYHLDNREVIDASAKLSFYKEEVYLDNLYYGQFSSIEVFGKTYEYQLMLLSKQSQNPRLFKELINRFKDQITNLIIKNKYDAIGFIPPTVKRNIQFIDYLRESLNLPLPHVKITKIKSEIMIPQKTLSKPAERIRNAKNTFIVEDTRNFHKVLLIDDFAGSGSSLNFVAQKVKQKNNSTLVDGYVLAGSANGVINDNFKKFEVVNEV